MTLCGHWIQHGYKKIREKAIIATKIQSKISEHESKYIRSTLKVVNELKKNFLHEQVMLETFDKDESELCDLFYTL